MENRNTGNIRDRVIKLVAKSLDIDLDVKMINEESEFVKDLHADSLHLVELIMAVEEEFKVEVPDSEASKMRTIGDVIRYVVEEGKDEVG